MTILPFTCLAQTSIKQSELIIEKYDESILNEENADELKLFVFYSTTCPICKNYTKTVREIVEKYKSNLTCYLVFSGKHHSKKEVAKYMDKYSLNIPAIIDKKYRISDELKAKITPEVVLYLNGKIHYQGAIDDWIIRLGMTKDKITKFYLVDAIESVLNDGTPEIVKHDAIGCFIR